MSEIKNDRSKILIVEDDKNISYLLSYYLSSEGFDVELSKDGMSAMKVIGSFNPELIILDIMLPDMDGFEICKNINKSYSIPIIMLTAKCDIEDKLKGLSLGADDYITKPFDIREVLARVKCVIKRTSQAKLNLHTNRPEGNPNILAIEDIKIIKEEHRVVKSGEDIELTNKEYDLLLLLAENYGIVFSRDTLLEKIWGFEYYGDTRTVDVHIQRLRKKLGETTENSIIKTIFKAGYKVSV